MVLRVGDIRSTLYRAAQELRRRDEVKQSRKSCLNLLEACLRVFDMPNFALRICLVPFRIAFRTEAGELGERLNVRL